jgi:putative nucleotidyltransferase with HDIG domain
MTDFFSAISPLPLPSSPGDTADEFRRGLADLLEQRDLETMGHTDRVVDMSARLAEHLGLDREERQALRWGAYLHDIGKIALPDQILLKPGPLTVEEFAQVRRHSEIGYAMLADLPFLPANACSLVRHHHERWDGRGYPNGLAGRQIPLLARLFSTVDVYDALSSRRPYKPAWSRQRSLEHVRSRAGSDFDPEIAAAFLEMMEGSDAQEEDAAAEVTAPAE